MNSVLDDAEARIAPAAATAQTLQEERLDAMRMEIGRQHYERAKLELPKLEHFIANNSRPFLARLVKISQRAKNPLPSQVQDWIKEMVQLCDSVPNTIRAGVDGWDTLTPPIWTDGKSLDVNERARLIYTIRVSLRNWDGVQGRLETLRQQVEHFITSSGWPTASVTVDT